MCEELKKKEKREPTFTIKLPIQKRRFQYRRVTSLIVQSPRFSFETTIPTTFVCLSRSIHANLSTKKTPTREENALRTTRSISGRVGTKAKLEQISVPLAESRNRLSTLRVPTPIYAEELTTILPREHSRPSGLVMNRKPSLPRNIRQDARAFHSTCFKRSRHK